MLIKYRWLGIDERLMKREKKESGSRSAKFKESCLTSKLCVRSGPGKRYPQTAGGLQLVDVDSFYGDGDLRLLGRLFSRSEGIYNE